MYTGIPYFARLLVVASLGLLLLAPAPLAAQWKHRVMGVKLGVSIASSRNEEGTHRRPRLLLGGGAFLNYPLAPNLSLQPEVLFASKAGEVGRGRATDSDTAGDYRSRYSAGYGEIPLLFKVMAPGAWKVRPNVFAGPALAIRLFGAVDAGLSERRLKRTDWGAAAGAGLDFRLGERRVMVDGRYTFGLANILELADAPKAPDGAFLVSVGIGL